MAINRRDDAIQFDSPEWIWPQLSLLVSRKDRAVIIGMITEHDDDHGHHQQFMWFLTLKLRWRPAYFYRGWVCFGCQ